MFVENKEYEPFALEFKRCYKELITKLSEIWNEYDFEMSVGDSYAFPNYTKEEIATILIDDYNEKIPDTIEELIKLPGIGRKCASVILSEIYDIPAFAVDTHVIRISNRLGLVKTKDPVKIEKKLKKLFKKNTWNKKHKQLVLFGRYYCKAKNPNCQNCKLQKICLKKD